MGEKSPDADSLRYIASLNNQTPFAAVNHRKRPAVSYKDGRSGNLPQPSLVYLVYGAKWRQLVLYGTFSTNRLYHALEIGKVSHRAGGEHKYHAIK